MSTDPNTDEIERILANAEEHVEALTLELVWESSTYSATSGHWRASAPGAEGRIRSRVVAALDFLERNAGSESRWAVDANNEIGDSVTQDGTYAISEIIRRWIAAVRSGQVRPRLTESFSVSAVSSTDLLEQVRLLNADKDVIPAAPIMLAGVALEIALRTAVEELNLVAPTRPSIDAYAKILLKAEVLNSQGIKDVTQMAGLRNNAAHGNHDDLDQRQANLLEQQVNHFLNRLDEAVRNAI